MKRVQDWENTQGHHWEGEKVTEKNASKVESLTFVYLTLGKFDTCQSSFGRV